MKKSDMKLFLNTEEEQDVKDSIRLLMKKTPPEINDFIESGGLVFELMMFLRMEPSFLMFIG